jgi:hypothetical protein
MVCVFNNTLLLFEGIQSYNHFGGPQTYTLGVNLHIITGSVAGIYQIIG